MPKLSQLAILTVVPAVLGNQETPAAEERRLAHVPQPLSVVEQEVSVGLRTASRLGGSPPVVLFSAAPLSKFNCAVMAKQKEREKKLWADALELASQELNACTNPLKRQQLVARVNKCKDEVSRCDVELKATLKLKEAQQEKEREKRRWSEALESAKQNLKAASDKQVKLAFEAEVALCQREIVRCTMEEEGLIKWPVVAAREEHAPTFGSAMRQSGGSRKFKSIAAAQGMASPRQ